MFRQNPLTNCDSYKLGHMAQYPPGTELVYSNFTPRSMAHLDVPDEYKTDKIVWFGLAGVLREMVDLWNREFFTKPIEPIIAEFERRIAPFVGPSGFDVNKIRELHALGYLPIEMRALPEGSRVPVRVPTLVMWNTNPKFYWLTNYLETWLSCELWKMSTSATIADVYKRILVDYAARTGAPLDFVVWQAHDFSMRGMSNVADAAKSGAAHLLSFTGTDCLPAVDYLEQFYGAKSTFVGGSVPASEHSVMCLGGCDDEVETFRRLIEDVYPSGVVSIVSDTWDFWKVLTEYTVALKGKILNRTPDAFGLAKTVFRPDSGCPVKVITGYDLLGEFEDEDAYYRAYDSNGEAFSDYSAVKIGGVYHVASHSFGRAEYGRVLSEAEVKGAVQVLWDIFDGTVTDKGYKVLHERVGLIYGDSITTTRCLEIVQRLHRNGFASCNIVLGVGSYTYQHVTRDTLGFAVKSTYGVVNGVGRDIYKNPKTDSGVKKSAKGLVKVVCSESGNYELVDGCTDIQDTGELKTVFRDGVFHDDIPSLCAIRERLIGC